MEIDKDMENFAEDASLNNLSNHGLGAMNLGKKGDYYGGANKFDADDFPDNLSGTLLDDIKSEPSICNSEPVLIPSGKRSSNKSLFALDNNIVETTDVFGWRKKRKEEWRTIDTINWILSNGAKSGQSFGSMSPGLALPGKELLNLSKREFTEYNGDFGESLFNLLHKGRKSKKCRRKWVAKLGPTKKPPSNRPLLPIFIRNLLFDPKYSGWIHWENYEEKSFRFVQGNRVAELWGKQNGKLIDFDYFTRAIRYWYDPADKDDGILAPHPKRLVYRFGKKATGLQFETDNPHLQF